MKKSVWWLILVICFASFAQAELVWFEKGPLSNFDILNFDFNETACTDQVFVDTNSLGVDQPTTNLESQTERWLSSLESNRCCNQGDEGVLNQRTSDKSNNVFNTFLCDGELGWLNAAEIVNKFKIVTIGKNDYVSNSKQWFKCDETTLGQGIGKNGLTTENQAKAAQFLCVKMDDQYTLDDQYIFLECCDNGPGDERKCSDINKGKELERIRIPGESTILVSKGFSFTTKYPEEVFPDSPDADYNPIFVNWEGAEALEVFFTVEKNWDFDFIIWGKDEQILFKDKLVNYVVGNPGYNKRMRAIIPLQGWRQVENFGVDFATENNETYYQNQVVIEKMFLRMADKKLQQYCSGARYKAGVLDSVWIQDLDNNQEGFAFPGEQPEIAGKKACNNFDYIWTGSQCCGDDLTENFRDETYEDALGGCWASEYLGNNSAAMEVSYGLTYNTAKIDKQPLLRKFNSTLNWNDQYRKIVMDEIHVRVPKGSNYGAAGQVCCGSPESGWRVQSGERDSMRIVNIRECGGVLGRCDYPSRVYYPNDQGDRCLGATWDKHSGEDANVLVDMLVWCVKDIPRQINITLEVDASESPREVDLIQYMGNPEIEKSNIVVQGNWKADTLVYFKFGNDAQKAITDTTITMPQKNEPNRIFTQNINNPLVMQLNSENYKLCSDYSYSGISRNYDNHPASCADGFEFEAVNQECSILDYDTYYPGLSIYSPARKAFVCKYGGAFFENRFRLNATWRCCKEKAFVAGSDSSAMPEADKYTIHNHPNLAFQSTGEQQTTDKNDPIIFSTTLVEAQAEEKTATFFSTCTTNVCDIPLAGSPPYIISNHYPGLYNLYFVNKYNQETLIDAPDKRFEETGNLRARGVPLQVMFSGTDFWGCQLSDFMKKTWLDEVGNCEIKDQGFCAGKGGWDKGTSGGFLASQRNTLKPAVSGSEMADNYMAESCCPATACWNGTVCVADMVGKRVQPQYNYSCINGEWIYTPLLYTWSRDKTGYCPAVGDCLVEPEGNGSANYLPERWYGYSPARNKPICIADQQFIADNFCQNNVWESRTKQIATQLLNLVKTTGATNDYILYCDFYNNTFKSMDLSTVIEYIVGPKPNPNLPLGSLNQPRPFYSETKTNAVNNFCILNYNKISGAATGQRAIMATSLNIPVDHSTSSFLYYALRKSSPAYCNDATGSDVFNKCSNDDTLWYSDDLNALAFSDATFEMSGLSFFQEVIDWFRNPIKNTIDWITGYETPANQIERDYSFVGNTSKLQYFYSLARPDGRKITAVMEEINQSRFVLAEYDGFTTNMCQFIVAAAQNKGISTEITMAAAVCNQTGNNYKVFVDEKMMPGLWWEMTAGLMIS